MFSLDLEIDSFYIYLLCMTCVYIDGCWGFGSVLKIEKDMGQGFLHKIFS